MSWRDSKTSLDKLQLEGFENLQKVFQKAGIERGDQY